ncbi:hypothetical protein GP486_001368 [Trichoglossum hirsutum]|uniref:Uncharacterized protein n=1 Tax=Trichoglossum hirsutum TaxID=265104 RepID=A0A9P8LG66_9PEZI|nr:hypothetical protein GP486_001368 [Trichoglossum hirsutum]
MPAIFDSLVRRQHMTPHMAWRVAFIVPSLLITSTAIAMLRFCDDTPIGGWSGRHLAVHHVGSIAGAPGSIAEEVVATKSPKESNAKLKPDSKNHGSLVGEAEICEDEMVSIARGEVIQTPTWQGVLNIMFSLQSLALAAAYFCSFGGELAINSILGAYYLKNFPHLGQTGSGRWAAMYGLLNVVARPAGGFVGDILYNYTRSLWAKKFWVHFVGVVTGIFLIVTGIKDPHHQPTMIGLIAGIAFFHETGNGANFALVPYLALPVQLVISGASSSPLFSIIVEPTMQGSSGSPESSILA